MHMVDALISPAVGGTMWVISAGLIAYCARKVQRNMRDNIVPMMGVMGAFIFAAQMINFSIPGTGSSGHLVGGLILSVLLGPPAAFLAIASVLTVQALFFADGGLLVLGCNIFNLGFFPAFIAYPFLYRLIARGEYGTLRAGTAAIIAAVVGLQLGAFSVVLETKASGISELPFGAFLLLMQPIHLAIGVVEGLATAAVVAFVARARPEAMFTAQTEANKSVKLTPVLIGLMVAALAIGGAVSWFASTHPDGLEWSIAKVTGKKISGLSAAVHRKLAAVQEKTAFLPDYNFKLGRRGGDAVALPLPRAAHGLPVSENQVGRARASGPAASVTKENTPSAPQWPAVSAGTSLAGIVGGLITLALACLVGFVLKVPRTKL